MYARGYSRTSIENGPNYDEHLGYRGVGKSCADTFSRRVVYDVGNLKTNCGPFPVARCTRRGLDAGTIYLHIKYLSDSNL